MGEEHILRGELIYTFNYLGSTLLLDDAFRFSTRALATAARQPWWGSREPAKGVAGASPTQGCCSITVLIQLHLVAARRGARWVFSSLSPKTNAMLNPCSVNLQPAGASRSLSTKEGNKAVWEGTSWTRSVERGGGDACAVRATNLRQIPGKWEAMAIMAPFLLFPNCEFHFI